MAVASFNRSSAELGILPRVCICCGEPATQTAEEWFSIVHGGGVSGAIFDQMGGGWFTDFVNFEKIKLIIPVCEDHQRPPVWQATSSQWGCVLYFVFVTLSLTLFYRFAGPWVVEAYFTLFLVLAGMVGVAWFAFVIRRAYRALCVTTLTANTITMTGVSPVFAQAASRPHMP